MKLIHKFAAVAAVALSATVFAAAPGSAATAKPVKYAGGAYCLMYDKGGSDCSFHTFAKCQESASGISAQCILNVFHKGDSSI